MTNNFEWVNVKSYLPSCNVTVLVYFFNKFKDSHKYQIEIVDFIERDIGGIKNCFYKKDTDERISYEVLAWAYIPEVNPTILNNLRQND